MPFMTIITDKQIPEYFSILNLEGIKFTPYFIDTGGVKIALDNDADFEKFKAACDKASNPDNAFVIISRYNFVQSLQVGTDVLYFNKALKSFPAQIIRFEDDGKPNETTRVTLLNQRTGTCLATHVMVRDLYPMTI